MEEETGVQMYGRFNSQTNEDEFFFTELLWELTESLPTKVFTIQELEFIMDKERWDDSNGETEVVVPYTPLQVINNPQAYPSHQQRIANADLTYPILVVLEPDLDVLDGVHRLLKQMLSGNTTITGRVIPPEILYQAKVPFSVKYATITN